MRRVVLLVAFVLVRPTNAWSADEHPPVTPPRPRSLAEEAAPKRINSADLPDGFFEKSVARGLTGATAMAVAADGRLFVCEQTGALRVIKEDRLLKAPFVRVKVDSQWERGLIGVALHPDFPRVPYVYLCSVVAEPFPHHRLSRWTARGDVAEPGSEVVLFEGDDQTKLGGQVPAGHQGGALHFGKDRCLYLAVGEQTAGLPAQRLDTLQGKLLRLNADGSIPADNPFFRVATGKYRSIWALGLRNPFTFAVQPGTGRIFINDVGEARWEEINEGFAGANYGWPHVEGPGTDARYRAPLHAYDRSAGRSIAGGTFYNPPVVQFPAEYVGKYFFADFMDNWIRVLDPDRPRDVRRFASGLAGPVDLQVGPDGSLYYLNRNAWVKDGAFPTGTGTVQRIRYRAQVNEPAPLITAQPQEETVTLGQSVTFRVAATGQGPLQYQWQRNGIPLPGAATATYRMSAVTAADQGARFRCVVSNALGSTKSRPAAMWITELRPPTPLEHSVPGLTCAVYRGQWEALPDFERLQPVQTSTDRNLDRTVPHRDTETGWVFKGYLRVPADGVYTFWLHSHGASKLFLAAAEVVSLAVGPSSRCRSGVVGLKAGAHSFLLLAAQPAGQPELRLEYAGPGIDRQPIPDAAFVHLDPQMLSVPIILPPGGTFHGPILVRLASPTGGSAIHWTTDGTEPTRQAPRYERPLRLDHSVTLRARTFRGQEQASAAISAATFTIDGETPCGLPYRELATTLTVPPDPADLPRLLSQTGIFRSLHSLTPNPGIVPYAVNTPLWSDGASKRRWIALPGDRTIRFAPTGEWRFPAGTVFVKHFELGATQDPAQRRRLETRLLVVDKTGGGYGVTYRWRPDQSDAELLTEAQSEDVSLPTAGGTERQNWYYPSRSDCLVCHTTNAGFVLGVKTRQLNGRYCYPATGIEDQQLRTWNHLGLFEERLPENAWAGYARLAPLSDSSASLEQRSRSYLDANCAPCHRPGGSRGEFDARFDTPLGQQKLLRGRLVSSDLGLRDARLIAPGQPERSMLWLRLKRRQDAFNMPPLATQRVDDEAVTVVADWIRSMSTASPLPTEPRPVLRHVKVYAEPGRFGGWPANHGIWSWGDEILVGFSAGYFKDNGPNRHAIDHDRPEEHLLARSRDGGVTWTIENPAPEGVLVPRGKALHGLPPPGVTEKPWQECPGGIDFTHPDFALTVRMTDVHAGPARFAYSTDRGRSWQGPFRLPLFGQKGIAARTDYIVNGKHDCMLFLTAAKRDGREGRPLCVRSTDGGKSWQFVSWITDEPQGYAIMPSTVRLRQNELLSAIRWHEGTHSGVDLYRSLDDGKSWQRDQTPAPDLGEGNPASLIQLTDGRLCLTYGYRAKPYGIRARLSRDGGHTWEPEILLRSDGGGRDLGYPRSVQRTDGKIVTIYYFEEAPQTERYIAATIWDPGPVRPTGSR